MCERCYQIKKATAEINASSIENKAEIIKTITTKINSQVLAKDADLTSAYITKPPINEEPPVFSTWRIKDLLSKAKDIGIVYPSLWDFESEPTAISLTTALDMLKTANIIYPAVWKFVETRELSPLLKAITDAGIRYPATWDSVTTIPKELMDKLGESEITSIKDCIDDPDIDQVEKLVQFFKSSGIVEYLRGLK